VIWLRSLGGFFYDCALAALNKAAAPVDRALVHLMDDEEDQWLPRRAARTPSTDLPHRSPSWQ